MRKTSTHTQTRVINWKLKTNLKKTYTIKIPLVLFSLQRSPQMTSARKTTINNLSSEVDELSLRSLSSEDVSQASPRGYCCAKSINPAAGRGRKLHLLQMLILPFIPIMALIVQTTMILDQIMIYRNEVTDIETQVSLSLITTTT